MKKVNIILPVYNEEQVIEKFTIELFKELKKFSAQYTFEVIYILDKSRDRSAEIISGLCDIFPGTKLVMLSRRFGHQMSLVAGMDQCDGDAVIMMDCDLQHPPAVIGQLLQKFEEGYDVVHTIRNSTEKIGYFRKKASTTFYRVIQGISEVKISEDAADFRLISKHVLNIFKNDIREHNQFLRGLFHWVGFNQTYVNFDAAERAAGKTKYDLRRLFRFALIGITSFSKTPLKFSIAIGFTVSLASFGYAAVLIFDYFTSTAYPPGWATLAVILLFFMGIQFIFMGILGEYIGAIFDETKKRPLYVVEKMVKSKS